MEDWYKKYSKSETKREYFLVELQKIVVYTNIDKAGLIDKEAG